MVRKKVVVLGGGTGMSNLLSGLKKYPLDITAIVSVCDDGKSTGILREEFNIPAVGDIRRVLVALSETEPLVMDLFNYRFETTSDLDGHTVGNLLLTAASEKYPSLVELGKKMADLYSASVNAFVQKRGENQIVVFELSLINNEYAYDGVNLFDEETKLLSEVMLKPYLKDGKFDEEIKEAQLITITCGGNEQARR